MYKAALVALFCCSLSFVLVTGQTCTDSCRVVCDSESAGSIGQAVRRGKQGAKGEKGDVGARGEKGSDNSDLIGRLEKRIVEVESINERILKQYNSNLKSKMFFTFKLFAFNHLKSYGLVFIRYFYLKLF